MVLIVLTVFLIITLIQVVYLLKKNKHKETILVIILMIFSTIYGISGVTRWNFPSPEDVFEAVFKPLSDIVFEVGEKK